MGFIDKIFNKKQNKENDQNMDEIFGSFQICNMSDEEILKQCQEYLKVCSEAKDKRGIFESESNHSKKIIAYSDAGVVIEYTDYLKASESVIKTQNVVKTYEGVLTKSEAKDSGYFLVSINETLAKDQSSRGFGRFCRAEVVYVDADNNVSKFSNIQKIGEKDDSAKVAGKFAKVIPALKDKIQLSMKNQFERAGKDSQPQA